MLITEKGLIEYALVHPLSNMGYIKIMSKIEKLIEKGVKIGQPAGVEIGDEVDIDRISADGVVIHAGCKIFGADTLILSGVKLGYEAPATVDNCQIGPDVELKGGYFNRSVFLEKAKLGLGAHVREATILEEQTVIAHTVALKHTILFPFVTLGSLINFCDCLMAGGTSRKNHSEVGSSYIHFNFTPNQDKATASLIGDVPSGVMLNRKPIFLGGQGGMVGPCRLNFGITVAAGTIVRKDEIREDRLIFGGEGKAGSVPFAPGKYRSNKRIIMNNIIYIGNLIALEQWYRQVRTLFISDRFPEPLMSGLKRNIGIGIEERIKRLEMVCLKSPKTGRQKSEFHERWLELKKYFKEHLKNQGDVGFRDKFLDGVSKGISTAGKDYIAVIQGLAAEDSEFGTRWLQGIIDDITTQAQRIMPSLV